MSARMFDFFNVKPTPTKVESSENSHSTTFQPIKPGTNKSKNTGLKVRQPFAERGPQTPLKTNVQTKKSELTRSELQGTPKLKETSKKNIIPVEDFDDFDFFHTGFDDHLNFPYDENEHILPKKYRFDRDAIIGILKSAVPSLNSHPKFIEPEPVVAEKVEVPEWDLHFGDDTDFPEYLELQEPLIPTFDDDDFLFEAAMQ